MIVAAIVQAGNVVAGDGIYPDLLRSVAVLALAVVILLVAALRPGSARRVR